MNTEYRLRRLERTLGTLISWLQIDLGLHNTNTLLDTLAAPEDPNNLEGPGRTEEEMAAERRELNRVAPTPADKFALMFGANRKEPEEVVEAVCSSFLEWLDNPTGNSATANLRNELCQVIQQREDLKKERDELRERVEKVIGHWRDTDWFREGSGRSHPEIVVGVNEAEAIKLLKYLKP